MAKPSVSTLLLFGATGDLAQRMLLPSLYGLHADGLLPDGLKVIGTARSDLDDAGFRAEAMKALADHVPADFYDEVAANTFADRLGYVALDASDPAHFDQLADRERTFDLGGTGVIDGRVDQRGALRTPPCDIGAYEVQP